MPRPKERPDKIGGFWLSRRPNSPVWCRTWYDARPDGKRQTVRASLGETDRAAALGKLAEWYVLNGPMNRARAEDVPVGTVLDRYADRAAGRVRSLDQIKRSMRLWNARFGNITVAALTPSQIEAWGRELARAGRSPGYISRILRDGRSALNAAHKGGEVLAVPHVPVSWLPKPAPRQRLISPAEAAAFWDTIDCDYLRTFFMILANTGARKEAILELQIFQVDAERRLISFNPPGREQTKKRRPVVRITDTLLPWLTTAKGPYVVSYQGRKLDNIRAAWERARDAAGLGRDIVPTTFRHTLHTVLWEADSVSEKEIADWFARGAADPMTDHYVKRRITRDGYLSTVAAEIDRFVKKIGERTTTPLSPMLNPVACELRATGQAPSGCDPAGTRETHGAARQN